MRLLHIFYIYHSYYVKYLQKTQGFSFKYTYFCNHKE